MAPAAETQSVMQTGKVLACRDGNALPAGDFSNSGSEGELQAQAVGLPGCAAACEGKLESSLLALPARSAAASFAARAAPGLQGQCAPAVSTTASVGGLRLAVLASSNVVPSLPAEVCLVAPSPRPAPPLRVAAAAKTIVPRRRERMAACPGRLSRAAWAIAPSCRAERPWRSSRDLFPSASVVSRSVRLRQSGLKGCPISVRSCRYRRLGFRSRPSAGPPVPDFGLPVGHRSRVVARAEAARVCAASQMPRFRFFVTHATGRAPVGVVPMVVPCSRVGLANDHYLKLHNSGFAAVGLSSWYLVASVLLTITSRCSDGPAAETQIVSRTCDA
jgi:hypothetical protein